MDSSTANDHGGSSRDDDQLGTAGPGRFRRLGKRRLPILYAIAARHFNENPSRDAIRAASAEVRSKYGSIISVILLQLAIAFVKYLIERWLDDRLDQAPPYSDDDLGAGLAEPKRFLWGEPPKTVKGSYTKYGYSGVGKFGPREAGSAFAFAGMIQPVILSTSYAIEQYAMEADPMANGMSVFGMSYLTQLVATVALKIIASLLRNFGSSVVRDIGAWLWYHVSTAIGVTLWDSLPWRRKRRRPSPDRDDDDRRPPSPRPNPQPKPKPIRPVRDFLDWLFPRR